MSGSGDSYMTGSAVAEMCPQTRVAEGLVLDLKCWDDAANWNKVIFDFAVKKATGFGNVGQFELALQWCSLAGWFASRHGYCGKLSSVELEAELLRAAKSLPVPNQRTRHSPPRRWLHVLSAGYETLGHTNLCRRWIEYSADLVHDVILLEQSDSIPKNLNAVVVATGGQCIALDTAVPLLERAALLRAYAWEQADVVVLHTHPEDVMATTAFGIAGGPPVMLVNHADHSFWTGCSVADLVLDIRDSGHSLTRSVRGVDRATIVPIPLFDEQPSSDEERKRNRAEIRKRFGIPEQATVLLTVGSPAKYRPVPGLDFVVTAREIVQRCPDTYLIAVGPEDKGEWKAAKEATLGRILPIGYQSDTGPFCSAADIYLEGFPTGSLTAFLEAGLAGLPCVRSPRECVPPFCSDGLSVRHLPQPADLNDYVSQVLALVANPSERAVQGHELREATKQYHSLPGWLSYVRNASSLLPATHGIYPGFQARTVSPTIRNWFAQYLFAAVLPESWTSIVVPFFIEAWRRTNTEPLLDASLIGFKSWDTLGGKSISRPRRSSLRLLNQKIRREGAYERFLHEGRQQFKRSNLKAARTLTYKCLRANPRSMADAEWWKLLLKALGAYKFIAKIRRIFQSFHAEHRRRHSSVALSQN